MDPASNVNMDGLSERDQQELKQTITHEIQKSQIQENVHKLTEMCFKKCITARISSPQLDRSEEPCVHNCVQRFMDANALTIKHFEKIRTGN